MKKSRSPYMIIINNECKKDGKGRFKTADVLRVSHRLYNEQQQIIKALREHLASVTRTK